jgi:cyclic dehypoxanthinyl futalosine synthase
MRTASSPRRIRRLSWACRSSPEGSSECRRSSTPWAFSRTPPPRASGGAARVREILSRARGGERLSWDDALALFREATLLEAGGAADAVRRRLHPADRVTYQVDRNINYTNVCIYRCAFCAFYRPAGDAEGYVLSFEEIGKKVEETIALGGTGILLQGGVHAELPFSYYEDVLSYLREKHPRVHRHAFSAPEIHFLAKKEKATPADVLKRLQGAGMQSLPGGGAEILEDEVRKRIWALTKAPTAKWAEVHRAAHRLGMPTTATMMFGVGESHEQRLHHLDVVRRTQDESLAEKGESFTAFIPWTFQEENTALDGKVETAGGVRLPPDARDRAALSRQRPARAGLVAHAGREDRERRGRVRRGRPRLDHDRGERRRGRRLAQPDGGRGGHAPSHPRLGLHAGQARLGLRALPRGLLPRPARARLTGRRAPDRRRA